MHIPSCLRALILVALCLSLPGCAKETSVNGVQLKGAQVGVWTMDLDAAKKLARDSDLPMLLNFTGSDWAQYCQTMAENVFSRPPWQEFAGKRFVLVTIDRPEDVTLVPKRYRERNATLFREHKIEGVPTYILLDSDGESLLARLGVPQPIDANVFARQLTSVLRHRPAEKARFISELSADQQKRYNDLLANQEATRKELNKWIKTNPPQNETSNAAFQAFQQRILEHEQNLEKIELEHAVSRLGADAPSQAYHALEQARNCAALMNELHQAAGDLENWLLTRPETTPENRQKCEAQTSKLHEVLEKIARSAPPKPPAPAQ